ncbi:MAG: single-stranded-DNA-specific exonuclease RecJ [Gammaproteobacteria bacterium]|nr:single-stranded-DNA-specific exonuclease RecJ [Gammaproteobacteria bacterium]
MQKHIVRRTPNPLASELPAQLHPVLRRVLSLRGVCQTHELDLGLEQLLPHTLLKGMSAASALLATAVMAQKKLLVVGDFDADGATSSALAVAALRALGAHHVDFLVPNRFTFGYGLTPEIVEVAASYHPDLLITVDNGISSLDGVAAAKARGMQVLITDHHLPGAVLPAADAIVNPNQPGDVFPSKSLAGVGVIFYVLLGLRAELRARGWFTQINLPEPNLARFLDLVALGTVADVVPLDRNNRILVHQGLRRIRAGHCTPGITALIQVAGRVRERLTTSDLAFALGPRLNAAGRMEDMSLGIACLLAEQDAPALRMAEQLDGLNQERKFVEDEMKMQAMSALQRVEFAGNDGMPFGLVVYDAHWHPGVIGILASRVKDKYHRPVIAFADANESEIKGSARSIEGVHIRDVLDAVAAAHPGILKKFGGHAMAAGMTLAREHLDEFRMAFDMQIRKLVSSDHLRGLILSDGELTADEISLETADVLRNGMPWGQGFPEPQFDGKFTVVDQRIMAEKHLKLSLTSPGLARPLEAVAFSFADRLGMTSPPQIGDNLHIAYKLEPNHFRGETRLQLMLEYALHAA